MWGAGVGNRAQASLIKNLLFVPGGHRLGEGSEARAAWNSLLFVSCFEVDLGGFKSAYT